MNFLTTLYKKEILEVLRDRRTLISMVVVPLLAIPILVGGLSFIMFRAEEKLREERLKVILAEDIKKLEEIEEELKRERIEVFYGDQIIAGLREKLYAAAIDLEYENDKPLLVIYFDATRGISREGKRRIESAFERVRRKKVERELLLLGKNPEDIEPFKLLEKNIASPEKLSGYIVGRALGYIIIILMFSGSMYAAIDLTAGEKERRTLEILLSAPIKRRDILIGKILVVTTVAIVTALLNLLSFGATFFIAGQAGLFKEIQGMFQHFPIGIFEFLLLIFILLPFSVFVSSLEISIASFARSYKEAQSYLTPLMMVVIFPAIVSFLPGVTLSPKLALIPVLNVAQVVREVLGGEFSISLYLLSAFSNIFYALLAFMWAKKLFEREEILFRI
jgi:sodium transport system permease protein